MKVAVAYFKEARRIDTYNDDNGLTLNYNSLPVLAFRELRRAARHTGTYREPCTNQQELAHHRQFSIKVLFQVKLQTFLPALNTTQ